MKDVKIPIQFQLNNFSKLGLKFFQLWLAPPLKLKWFGVTRYQIYLLEWFKFRRHSHLLYDVLAIAGFPGLGRDMLFVHIPKLATKATGNRAPYLAHPPKTASISRDTKRAALAKFLADLESHGVRPFLCFGVLLGYVREGDFMSHDPDLDLGIFLQEHTCNQIHDFLINKGYQIDSYHPDPWPCRLKVTPPCSQVPIDIVFFHPSQGMLQTYAECFGHCLVRNRTAFEIRRAEFQGIQVWIPEEPEFFLTENYKNWQQKSPYYHYVLTSPLTDFSHPAVEYCLARELAHSLYRNHTSSASALVEIGQKQYPESSFWQNLQLQKTL